MAAACKEPSAGASQLTIAEHPSVMVAHPMGDQDVPLGLDRPLSLLGGGRRLASSEMPSALGIDHVSGLRRFVAEACRRRAVSGLDGYHQPPLALLGENGIGKGFVAHWIARNAGLPLYRIRVGPDFGTSPAGRGVEHGIPLLPVVAIAAGRCANPVIVLELDVDDPITVEAEDVLVSMIDPRANSRWIDQDQQTILDLSCRILPAITRAVAATAFNSRCRSSPRRRRRMGRASGRKPIEADNQIREVRHKMLQVAQTRLRTALNRLTPKDDPPSTR